MSASNTAYGNDEFAADIVWIIALLIMFVGLSAALGLLFAKKEEDGERRFNWLPFWLLWGIVILSGLGRFLVGSGQPPSSANVMMEGEIDG